MKVKLNGLEMKMMENNNTRDPMMTPIQKLIEAATEALRLLRDFSDEGQRIACDECGGNPHECPSTCCLRMGEVACEDLERAISVAKQEQQADPLDPWLAKIMRHMTDAELERFKELAGIVLSESKAAQAEPSTPTQSAPRL